MGGVRRGLLFAVLLLAVPMLAVACGNDDAPEPTPGETPTVEVTPTPTTPPPTDTPEPEPTATPTPTPEPTATPQHTGPSTRIDHGPRNQNGVALTFDMGGAG